MKFGYYADREMPVSVALDREPLKDYKVNSHGYRCPDLSCGVAPRLFKPGGFAAWSLSRLNNDDI